MSANSTPASKITRPNNAATATNKEVATDNKAMAVATVLTEVPNPQHRPLRQQHPVVLLELAARLITLLNMLNTTAVRIHMLPTEVTRITWHTTSTTSNKLLSSKVHQVLLLALRLLPLRMMMHPRLRHRVVLHLLQPEDTML